MRFKRSSLVHAAHVRCCRSCGCSRLLDVCHEGLGGQNGGSYGGSVLQSGTGDLRRVNDAFVDHVAVGIGQSIVAVADGVLCLQVLNDDGALQTCVRSNLANRLLSAFRTMAAPVFSSPSTEST